MIGQFQVRKLPYGPLALGHLSKRQTISFLYRNNHKSHIKNILLHRLLGPHGKLCILVFSFLVFMARALARAIKGRGKNSVHNLPYGPSHSANQRYVYYLQMYLVDIQKRSIYFRFFLMVSSDVACFRSLGN